MGVTSVLGETIAEYWDNLTSGKSGIGRITQFDASGLPCQIAGEINGFDADKYFDSKEARRMPRSSQMALAAAIGAVSEAGLPDTMPNPERSGVCFGTAMGGVDFLDDGIAMLRSKGYRAVSPFIAGGSIPNYPAFLIGKQFQCLGTNSTIVTACATGTQAVGEGAEFIRRGTADLVIVGGTESFIRDFGIGGFSAMRALPTSYNNNPEAASRPFDKDREGFILSEGAAALVLESLEHAKARGANIIAEVAGHASSTDGYHMSAPDPNANGPIRTMRWALEDAGLNAGDVDYINAHGTSTPLNDATETKAIKHVFGSHAKEVIISSTKSMLGHAMGASGSLEAIVCALAIREGCIPPTINYDTPDPELDLDYTPNQARQHKTDVTLSNSFGLGGQNACLVLKRFEN
jgi:beta-ketoacyl-acyl-carrier-protein synthase II